jgi:tight adherence protein B
MSITWLPVIVYAAVALIVAAVLLLFRDLFRRKPKEIDSESLEIEELLPQTAAARAAERDQSWLGQMASETGTGLTAATTLLLGILVALALGGGLYVWQDSIAAGVTGAMLGLIVLSLVLIYLRWKRHQTIRDQLPDVMELMARAVRAGESLDQAIQLAGASGMRPVASEFRYCAGQMKMGLSLEAAIRGMVARIPLSETRILAMTLALQRRRGGSLPTTLERLARVFRDRSNFYRQFQAATALGRGSAALIALIGIGLDIFVLLGNSDYAENLMTTNFGRMLFGLAILLQVVGIAWAVWLFRPRY